MRRLSIIIIFTFTAFLESANGRRMKRQDLFNDDDDGDDTDGSLPSTTLSSNSSQTCPDGRHQFVIGNIRIPCNYNKLEIPSYEQSVLPLKGILKKPNVDPFTIDVDIAVRSVGEIDEMDEEISIEMDFTAIWFDIVVYGENLENLFKENRTPTEQEIEKGLKALDPSFLDNIWKPDLFIENVIKFTRPSIMVRPFKLLFSSAGVILVSMRVTARLRCDMEFHFYPADTQYCQFIIRSYSHQSNNLKLVWNDPEPGTPGVGVRILDRSDHNFDIQIMNVSKYQIKASQDLLFKNYSETYDVLHFTIAARRILSYHMIQTYLPSLFFIIITWLCFLIPVSMVEARIGVAMTTLLTLTSMFSSVRESTPNVSHVKAIDVWMVACIIFVFSTLLEFTVLVFMRHVDENESDEGTGNSNNEIEDKKVETTDGTKGSDNFFSRILRRRRKMNEAAIRKLSMKRRRQAMRIEDWAFIIFILTFLLFNFIYWPYLLIESDYLTWTIDDRYNEP